MNGSEYIETVTLMMEKQDMYLMWFLGILSVVLVFVGFLQWRLSSEQIKKIKSETKAEARKEIIDELIKNYGVNSINEIINTVQITVNLVQKLSNDLNKLTIGQEFDFDTKMFYFKNDLENSRINEEGLYMFLIENHHILYTNKSAIYKLDELFSEHGILSKVDIDSIYWKSSLELFERYRKEYNNTELFKKFFNVRNED